MKTNFRKNQPDISFRFLVAAMTAVSLISPSTTQAQVDETTAKSDQETYENKCRFLNDDETWVTFCKIDLMVNASIDNKNPEHDLPTVDEAEQAFNNVTNWHNAELFASLSIQDRRYLYYYLSSGSAHLAFYEWACRTGKFSEVTDNTARTTRSIVNNPTAKLLLTRRTEELERMGIGLEERLCDYDQFYTTKKSELKQREKVSALLK